MRSTEQLVVADRRGLDRGDVRFDAPGDEPRVARRDAVANRLGRARRCERVGAGVVRAQHDERALRELGERALDVGEVGVDVEVVSLDEVRDDRDRRRECEKRPIVFVGFDDVETIATGEQVPSHADTRPPTSAVGSRPAAAKAVAVMTVVVVLPCVPATPTSLPSPQSLRRGLGATNDQDAEFASAGQLRDGLSAWRR